MPGFYEKMKSRLRTVEQGADTIIWLAVSNTALEEDSGKFYQGQNPISWHLQFIVVWICIVDLDFLHTRCLSSILKVYCTVLC